jgi:hypothetical protein
MNFKLEENKQKILIKILKKKFNNIISTHDFFDIYLLSKGYNIKKNQIENYSLYSYEVIKEYYKDLSKKNFENNLSLPKKLIDRSKFILNSKYSSIYSKDKKNILFYFRKKNGDNSSIIRNGSPLENYIDVLEYSKNNFNVFIMGDKYNKNLFKKTIYLDNTDDAKLLKVYLFSNYDYFVGESGGASFLPIFNKNKKNLCINLFPYGVSIPNSILAYKKVYQNKKNCTQKYFNFINRHHDYDNLNIEVKALERNEINEIFLEFLIYEKKIISREIFRETSLNKYSNASVSEKWKNMNGIRL